MISVSTFALFLFSSSSPSRRRNNGHNCHAADNFRSGVLFITRDHCLVLVPPPPPLSHCNRPLVLLFLLLLLLLLFSSLPTTIYYHCRSYKRLLYASLDIALTGESVVKAVTHCLVMVKIVLTLMSVLIHPVSMAAFAKMFPLPKHFIASVRQASLVNCVMHSNKTKLSHYPLPLLLPFYSASLTSSVSN